MSDGVPVPTGPLTTAAPTVVVGVNGATVTTANADVKTEPGASSSAAATGAAAAVAGDAAGVAAAANQVLDRRRLQELVKEVDAHEQLDEDVEVFFGPAQPLPSGRSGS